MEDNEVKTVKKGFKEKVGKVFNKVEEFVEDHAMVLIVTGYVIACTVATVAIQKGAKNIKGEVNIIQLPNQE